MTSSSPTPWTRLGPSRTRPSLRRRTGRRRCSTMRRPRRGKRPQRRPPQLRKRTSSTKPGRMTTRTRRAKNSRDLEHISLSLQGGRGREDDGVVAGIQCLDVDWLRCRYTNVENVNEEQVGFLAHDSFRLDSADGSSIATQLRKGCAVACAKTRCAAQDTSAPTCLPAAWRRRRPARKGLIIDPSAFRLRGPKASGLCGGLEATKNCGAIGALARQLGFDTEQSRVFALGALGAGAKLFHLPVR
eukprot:scaffold7092_cov262-Pinguiococcus_pyrenoidosus.AAC.21